MAYMNGEKILEVIHATSEIEIDQNYNSESENPQSGKAVAEAIKNAASNIDYQSNVFEEVGDVNSALKSIENKQMEEDMKLSEVEMATNINASNIDLCVKKDEVQNSYDGESEFPQSGKAVAEAISTTTAEAAKEAFKFKTICEGSLQNETKTTHLIPIPEDITGMKEFTFVLEFPFSATASANSIWVSAAITDENSNKYTAFVFSCGNQAFSVANGTARSVAVSTVFNKIMLSISQQTTHYLGSNSRSAPQSVISSFNDALLKDYPPFLKLTISAACPFKDGTKWKLEGR